MLQSLSLPSHFISISSQEAGNNLQINCHFYGTGAGGWDSLCPPIKDDVAVKKIKGNFLFTYPHAVVQYIISVWCLVLQGCYGFSLKCGNYFSWYRFSKIAWPPQIVIFYITQSATLQPKHVASQNANVARLHFGLLSIVKKMFQHRISPGPRGPI